MVIEALEGMWQAQMAGCMDFPCPGASFAGVHSRNHVIYADVQCGKLLHSHSAPAKFHVLTKWYIVAAGRSAG